VSVTLLHLPDSEEVFDAWRKVKKGD